MTGRARAFPATLAGMCVATILSCSGARPSPGGTLPPGPVEAYVEGSDLATMALTIDEALAADPDDPLLHWLAAETAYLGGDMDSAMDGYAAAVAAAPGCGDPVCDAVAEASLEAMLSLDSFAPRWEERLAATLDGSLPSLYERTDGAWFTALEAEVKALARSGRFEEALVLRDTGGCLVHWKAAGPIGSTELLGFDDAHDPEIDLPWKAAYPLVEGGDPVPTIDARAWYCRTAMEPEDTYHGGTYYAATDLSVHRSGDYVFRISTPDTFAVIVDGVTVLTVDRRTAVHPDVNLFGLRLAAGEHRLMVKIGTRDFMPTFTLMWKEASSSHPDPGAAPAITSRPHGEGIGGLAPPPGPAWPIVLPEPRSPVEEILEAQVILLRGDNAGSASAVKRLVESYPASAPVLALHATLQGSDPFTPWATRMNRLKSVAETMIEAHPDSWVGWYIVAQIESNLGRTENAIDMMNAAMEAIPGFPGFLTLAASLYASKGWVGESMEATRTAAGLLEGSCSGLRQEFSIAATMGDLDGMEEAARALSACDATDGTLLQLLEQRGKWDQALVEQERLHGLFPDRDDNMVDDALVMLELGYTEKHLALLEAFWKKHPTSWAVLGRLVDAEAAAGRTGEAVSVLARARALMSGPGDDLLMKIALVEGFDYLYPYRRDAVTSIASYEAGSAGLAVVPGTPSVEILDHVTHRIYGDGSTLTRYHSVRKLLSKEGVEAGSEFVAPPGAWIIRLRTIKADGRTLLPEDIEGKATLSYPSLSPGDYTEAEWIQATGPSTIFPGGLSLERWFFQVFDQVLYHSEMIVVAPAGMAIPLNDRGDPPVPVVTPAGILQVSTMTAERSTHVESEPGSPAWSEFLPSVQLSYRAGWGSYFDFVADMMVGTHIASPAMEELLGELSRGVPAGDRAALARAVFRWVNDEVEEGEGIDTPAAFILEDRMGMRVRLLYALLLEAGLEPELWIVRTVYADHTASDVADLDVYTQLAVRLGDDWLVPGADGLPYGLLPYHLRGEEAASILPSRGRDATPGASSFDDGVTRELEVVVGRDGSSACVLTDTFRGVPASLVRAGLREMEASEVEMQMEGSYLAYLFNGATMTGLELPDLSSDSPELTVTIRFDLPLSPGPLPGTASLGPFLKTRLSQAWASLPSREFPLLVDEPTSVAVRISVDTGGMWDLFQPPLPSTSLATPQGALFTQGFARKGDTYTLDRMVVLPEGRIAPEDYPALLDFTTTVDESEGSVFILVPDPIAMLGKGQP